jgi:hypothetical protein
MKDKAATVAADAATPARPAATPALAVKNHDA